MPNRLGGAAYRVVSTACFAIESLALVWVIGRPILGREWQLLLPWPSG